MDAVKRPKTNTNTTLPFTSTMWQKAGEPETRPDGCVVERFVASNGSTRETLKNPSPNAAAMLFGGPALRGWQNSKLLPLKEREIHPKSRSLIVREQFKATMWSEDAQGVITESPLTVDPVLGAPKRRIVQRWHGMPEGSVPENPEWSRIHDVIGTPL
ncbi:MAG TPA: hypothetical protein VGO93_12540 [Candidatus Xenobia bacterium]|jgi:hypothetical protein